VGLTLCVLSHRFPTLLGKGAFKTVFRGQDVNNGRLVAWNEVNIKSYGQKERKRIMNEIMLLRTLSHGNLISFYGGWVNKDAEKVIFVTELMSSGTLKEFAAKYPIPLKQIKRYCREILECMCYLHTPGSAEEAEEAAAAAEAAAVAGGDKPRPAASPPTPKPVVIHRDLKCDNIFIMHQGKGIKIGDLGLATTDGRSIMGTPEFMAPEMYETGYSTSVDVYAFGLCLLEMVTGRTPYVECSGVVAIYKRVLAGVPPENMRVLEAGWPEAHAFVTRCLVTMSEPTQAAGGLAAAPAGGSADEEEEEGEEEGEDGGAPTAPTPLAPAAGASLPSAHAVDAKSALGAGGVPAAGGAAQPGDGTATAPALPAASRKAARTAYVRPTALELLQDPFLTITEEDATRTTWDVRKAAESKGIKVVTCPEDVQRKAEPLAPIAAGQTSASEHAAASAPTVEPPAATPPADAESAAPESKAAAALPLGEQAKVDDAGANAPLTGRGPDGGANGAEKRKQPRQSSREPPQAPALPTLQSLSEEVKTLRHWVAQTYGLVEWLVMKQDGGREFLESRTGRRTAARTAPVVVSSAVEDVLPAARSHTRARSKSKSVSFAAVEVEEHVQAEGARPPVGDTDESRTTALPMPASDLSPSNAYSIEEIIYDFDETPGDTGGAHFHIDFDGSSEAAQAACTKLRFDLRREEYRAAKIGSKQLLELSLALRRCDEEHEEAVAKEEERHKKEIERSDKSRIEIEKVLLLLRAKRDRPAENDDVADDDSLSLRERTEEQMYSRRLELLITRETDENKDHFEAIKTLGENFERQRKRNISKEKEIRDMFASKLEKLRAEFQAACARALDVRNDGADRIMEDRSESRASPFREEIASPTPTLFVATALDRALSGPAEAPASPRSGEGGKLGVSPSLSPLAITAAGVDAS
jgi:WNK lysine deficient protein kinase